MLAGGTFLGILMNQRLLEPSCLLSLATCPGPRRRSRSTEELRLGRHGPAPRGRALGGGARGLARARDAFSLVASPRVRNQATVGGVLADADYASDPPAMLCALGAQVVARERVAGEREIPVEELITGYYETALAARRADRRRSRVPRVDRAVYRKFRSRSHEDRPCVSVAAVPHDGELRVVVGAVAEPAVVQMRAR